MKDNKAIMENYKVFEKIKRKNFLKINYGLKRLSQKIRLAEKD